MPSPRFFDVRPITAADVDAVEAALPSRGLAVHQHFCDRQAEGAATYLVAWADGEPVGSAVLRWTGNRSDPALPDHPEISNVGVAAPWRGRGAGSALIRAAEGLVAARGHRGTSVGVGVDNPCAARLYERLGYRPTGTETTTTYDYPDDDGVLRPVTETDRILRRDL